MVRINILFLEKKELQILAAMVILLPLAGEIKFYPFNEFYRVSFGPPLLFLFLLGLKKVPSIICGVLAGVSVLIFRITLDFVFFQPFDWLGSLHANFPSFFYYFTYSLVFFLLKIHQFFNRPWLIGLLGILTELAAGFVELIVETVSYGTMTDLDAINKIIIIAIFRSFFVIGLFSSIRLREANLREAEVQKRNEHMMLLVSNLYEETVLLKKTVQDAEEITKQSYNLYRELQSIKEENQDLFPDRIPKQALGIAGEVHEIKKDNQRILSGLSKLITDESTLDYSDIQSLFSLIVRTHRKYAEHLGKNIEFAVVSTGTHPPYHVYTFISIVNNLVSNAVEAIKETGRIEISADLTHDWLQIRIHDNGPGIPFQYQDVIFKPGFTLKFDSTGKSSTGIGLTYVKEIVKKLEGEIRLENQEKDSGTTFIVRLPVGEYD